MELSELIESERDNLSRAHSILACMVTGITYADDENDSRAAPDFADLARMAAELVRGSINRLDSVYVDKAVKVPPKRRRG